MFNFGVPIGGEFGNLASLLAGIGHVLRILWLLGRACPGMGIPGRRWMLQVLDVLDRQINVMIDVMIQMMIDVMRHNVLDVVGHHMLDVMGHHMLHMVGVVYHLVVDNLGLGNLENNQGTGQHQREQTQSHGLPGLECNESKSQGHQYGGLQLQTQQEGQHSLADHAASYGREGHA